MTQAVHCPSCKQQFTVDDSPITNQINQLQSEIEQLRKIPKMPSHIPNYQCEDGTCSKIHENPLYTKRPKGKCSHCDQYSFKKEGTCPWCRENDSIEEVDKDEIVDRGIRIPGEY